MVQVQGSGCCSHDLHDLDMGLSKGMFYDLGRILRDQGP